VQNVKEYIETTILDCLSSNLKVASETLDPDVAFSEYGLDSILGVNFIDQVNDRLLITMNTAIVFEYSSLERLTNHVMTTYKDQIEAKIRDQRDQNVNSNNENQTLLLGNSNQIKAAVSHKRRLFSRRSGLKNLQNERILSQLTEIAVTGISGKFPKANNINIFWKNLLEGVDGVEELPDNYLAQKAHFNTAKQSGKSYCKWGGILKERDCFDPLFFNISPREAESMNPHQRLVLQESWKAIEDAGYNPKSLSGSITGVFIGAEPTGYFHESFTGSSEAIIASRLSYFLNLNGPAFVVNTGCSSSGVALHQACESLRNRESDLALAGGVNACMGPDALMLLSEIDMLSPSGKCYTFDEAGDGTIISEGIGMVVLKRLEDAVASGDLIYGVISGSGINQDGASNGITAPSGVSQEKLITSVYRKYQINPEEIGYIEAHGTGTKLGDPVEANALVRAFQKHTRKQGFCAVGSAKSHIGHTAAAAGVIGLIKVLLSMQHGQIPALLHFKKLNSLIEFKESPFFINTQISQWRSRGDSPRMAALSSFGHSGTNAHLVIKEYVPLPSIQTRVGINRDKLSTLIPLSAKTEESLKASIEEFLLFLNELDKNITLDEIAYTLQTGREPMRYRIVFLAENISELKKQLDSFLKEEKDIKDCWKGKGEPNQTSLLSSDEDAQEMLIRWIEKNKLKKVGELWCQGVPIEWDLLYSDNKPGRIHLPTYSFAKERYWIPNNQSDAVASKRGSHHQSMIHPLLHENTSDLSEQRFTSTFTDNEFFLNDHKIKGEKVLPGVSYLEMARAAVSKASGEKEEGTTIHLKHVVWSQPIVVDGSAQEVHIGLYAEDDGQIQYEVYTESDNEESVIIHSQGVVEFKEKEETPPLDIQDLQSQMNQGILNEESCYQTFIKMGINYGEGSRGIRKIYEGDNQVLARLSLPSSVHDTQDEYVLHPSLMDSAIQSSIGLMLSNSVLPDGIQSASSGSETPLKPSLPFALESLKILGPCTSGMYAWVRYSGGSAPSDKVQKLDIDLCDELGNICVKMRGLETKEFKENYIDSEISAERTLDKIPEEETQLVCFEEVWQKEKYLGVTDKTEKTLLCFLSNSGLQKEFIDYIQSTSSKSQIIFISQGNVAQKSSSQQQYSIDPRKKESYLKVLQEIAETPKNIDAIVYLWPIEDSQLIQEMGPIVWILQSLKTLNVKVTDLLLAGEANNPREQSFLESWIGFERSLGMILPQTKVRVLIGSVKPSIRGIKDWAERIWNELHTADTKSVWYKDNERFVPQVRSLRLNSKKPLLKSQGTYLITGGLGGLGLLFAEHLIIKYKSNLILTGRSPLSREKQNRIGYLQQQGTKVVYLKADISSLETMRQALPEAIKEVGAVDGIIHAAGVEGKETIFEKDFQEFAQILSPKVQGTLNLDQLFKEESLDFICYFSSSSATLGDFGSCDYAIGNRFQMAYARLQSEHNSSGVKRVIINWPLWKEGGMGMGSDESTQFYLKTSGQDMLTKEQGLSVFDQILSSGAVQTLVLLGQPERIQRFLGMSKSPLPAAASKVLSVERTGRTPAMKGLTTQQCVVWQLKETVHQLLKVPKDQMEMDENLSDFGFDSITLAEFARNLSDSLGIEITPSLFFGYSTLEKLKNYLLEEHSKAIEGLFRESREGQGVSLQTSETHKSKLMCKKRARLSTQRSSPSIEEPIAIIGMSGRFPNANTVEEFWKNIKYGVNCIKEFPEDRLNGKKSDASNKNVEQCNFRLGGFIENVDQFDPQFFGILPQEAIYMDPRQRIFLEEAWHAFEDAGYMGERIQGMSCGVYVGVEEGEYGYLSNEEGQINSNQNATIAARIAYILNLKGPNFVLTAACSSGLVALHQACLALRQGDCEMALVGGVNLLLSPMPYEGLKKAGMLSLDGKCRVFDQQADGLIPSEAVAVVLLKSLSKAISDNDQIYGCVKASGVNYDGKTNGITAPNLLSQAELIKNTYENYHINPENIQYVMAHSVGSKYGDPVEIEALTKAFKQYTKKKQYCYLSSIKPLIGHTFAASGVVSLISMLMAIKDQTIPATYNFECYNEHINISDSPFILNLENKKWVTKNNTPRIGTISTTGISGTDAYAVIEEYKEQAFGYSKTEEKGRVLKLYENQQEIFPLSAKREEILHRYAEKYIEFLKSDDSINLASLAYSLQTGREVMEKRVAVVARSIPQLIEKLQQ
ncbi:MAG: SDR family NAD(P)-dependent oxidoreductase, partial [Planctomycetes bacterium]|nr:SDR family NAD(P)-dependent oxidoreductase [Planctomycetota bacterium]